MPYQYLNITQTGTDNNIYVITLQKPPENRLNVAACQEIIRAYREVETRLGSDAPGAVILTSSSNKFFTTGLDLHERDVNKFASSDGFYPLLHTILDFPFPTICAITGHVMGGACLLTLAHDYRLMNSKRGYWQMPPVNAGLHHDGMGTLVRSKLAPRVARKVLLEGYRFTGKEALEAGIVDQVAEPEQLLGEAIKLAEQWKDKAKMGVYAMLRDELWGDARKAYAANSYVHRKETAREPKVKL
jgi:Delta3-Delta2-enoyl-CoA isomerase